MLVGKAPFTGKNKKEFFETVNKGEYKIPSDIKPSDEILLLMG